MSGHVDLIKERFLAFRDSAHPGAVHLLNLIRLRERADYPDGRDVSGVEAYQNYGRVSEPVLAHLGVRIIWERQLETLLIRPQTEKWDIFFVAEYPSVQCFLEMMRDPIYREAVTHRKAAALDSRLIALKPRSGATRFGQFLAERQA